MYNQNGGFYPHNSQISPPVFQQNTIRPPAPFQSDAQMNSQHVFGNNPRFPTPSQPSPQFIPNLNFIRSTPPPAIISPRPELNLPDWKNSAPPRDISYHSSQLSTPRASTDYSAPHQLNGTFNQPRNGFVNNMDQFPSQNAQSAFPQPSTSFLRPSTFQMQSRPQNRPGSFDQQSPIRPSAFQQQSHMNNRPGSFDQQSMRPSAFQPQSHTNSRPGSFDKQSPIISSAFQQQSHTNSRPGSFEKQSPIISSAFQQHSHANNRHGAFSQQSSNSNNFHYKNRNKGNNPFGSQSFNSYDKNPIRHKNYNNKNNNRQNNWNGSSKGFNHFQGIKKEKEDKISSLPFSCDPCDRSFGTENELKKHLAEHITCDSGSCQFEAHPKIVFLHKKMQHVAGYAEKINKLSSNDEIEKWRAERRRRFPTQENIARRQAEQAEKEARGEVMETPESTGKMKRKGDHEGKSNNYKRRRHNNRFRNQHHSLSFKPKTEEDASEPESSDDETITKLAQFAGVNAAISSETDEDFANTSNKGEEAVSKEKISSLSELETGKGQAEEITVAENTSDAEEGSINELITINSSPNDSGSEKDSAKKTPADENTSKEKQGLASSNLVVYDISDDDDDAPIELPSKRPDDHDQNFSSSQGTAEVSGDQLPSEEPVNNTQSEKKNNGTGPKKDQDMPRRKREKREFIPRKKEEPKRCTISLLKAFYADEIKTERNKMFQCVRYIVQKNFFGIGE